MACIATPAGELDVYNIHLVSVCAKNRYNDLRRSQVLELAEMARKDSAGRPLVLLGDINEGPDDPEYGLLMDSLGLQDACRPDGAEACGVSNLKVDKRIDHIFLPAGGSVSFQSRLTFDGFLAGSSRRYSDHNGVEARLGKIASLER